MMGTERTVAMLEAAPYNVEKKIHALSGKATKQHTTHAYTADCKASNALRRDFARGEGA